MKKYQPLIDDYVSFKQYCIKRGVLHEPEIISLFSIARREAHA